MLKTLLSHYTDTELILFGVFVVAFIIQIHYHLLKIKLAFGKNKEEATSLPSVSIIIQSRNYLKELQNCLPLFLNQNYPDFEVIVVDDCSGDGTEEYLNLLKQTNPKLKSTFIKQSSHMSNAIALTVGVRASEKEWCLFVHPRSQPQSSLWLESFAKNFSKGKQVVMGYVKVEKRESLGNFLLRRESYELFQQRSAGWYLGMPMPLSAFNVAYRKEDFLKNKGFAGILKKPYAENELYINKISSKPNSSIARERESVLRFNGKLGNSSWVNLKQKSVFLRRNFSVLQRIFLLQEPASRYLLILLGSFFCLSPLDLEVKLIVVSCWATLLMLHFIWNRKLMKRLGDDDLLMKNFFYLIIQPLANGIVRWKQFRVGGKNGSKS